MSLHERSVFKKKVLWMYSLKIFFYLLKMYFICKFCFCVQCFSLIFACCFVYMHMCICACVHVYICICCFVYMHICMYAFHEKISSAFRWSFRMFIENVLLCLKFLPVQNEFSWNIVIYLNKYDYSFPENAVRISFKKIILTTQ